MNNSSYETLIKLHKVEKRLLEINNSQEIYNNCIDSFSYKKIFTPSLLRISLKKK